MHGRDGGLQLVRPDRVLAERSFEQADALRDLGRVPQVAALVGERDRESLVVRSCTAAGVGQQHEREQARGLRLIRQQLVQHPRQPDRLAGEVGAVEVGAAARRVSLVEHQVEHVQHAAQPLRAFGGRRHGERDAGRADGLLRA